MTIHVLVLLFLLLPTSTCQAAKHFSSKASASTSNITSASASDSQKTSRTRIRSSSHSPNRNIPYSNDNSKSNSHRRKKRKRTPSRIHNDEYLTINKEEANDETLILNLFDTSEDEPEHENEEEEKIIMALCNSDNEYQADLYNRNEYQVSPSHSSSQKEKSRSSSRRNKGAAKRVKVERKPRRIKTNAEGSTKKRKKTTRYIVNAGGTRLDLPVEDDSVDGDGKEDDRMNPTPPPSSASTSTRQQIHSLEPSAPIIAMKANDNDDAHESALETITQGKKKSIVSSPDLSCRGTEPLKQSQSPQKPKDDLVDAKLAASIENIRRMREQAQTNKAFVSASSPAAVAVGDGDNGINGNNSHRLDSHSQSQPESERNTRNNPQAREPPQSQKNANNVLPVRQRSLPLRLSTSHMDTTGTMSPRIQPQPQIQGLKQLQTQGLTQQQRPPPPNTISDNAQKSTTMNRTRAAVTKQNVNIPTTMSLTTPWARKFILSRPKDGLLPIPREFLSDGFNLVQLAPIVERAVAAISLKGKEAPFQNDDIHPNETGAASSPASAIATAKLNNVSLYKAALRLILETEEEGLSLKLTTRNDSSPTSIANSHSKYTPFQIQKAAEVLYTLVHARYVTSPRGLDTIRRMFKRNALASGVVEPIFGRCSRLACGGMPLLPIGMSDRYDIDCKGGAVRKAMRCCPSCRETFYMWDSKIDGAAWGTSFCNLFLMAQGSEVFGEWSTKERPEGFLETLLDQPRQKVFGFPIHPAADMNMITKGIRL